MFSWVSPVTGLPVLSIFLTSPMETAAFSGLKSSLNLMPITSATELRPMLLRKAWLASVITVSATLPSSS